MKITRFIIAILVVTIFTGCKNDGSPLSETYQVDPQLLGAWYYLDKMNVSYPSPNIGFRGMYIRSNKTIQSLGIENATGKVALLEETYVKQLLHADNGVLIVQYVSPPGMQIDTSLYRVERDTLFLAGRYRTSVHYRTQLGFVAGAPTELTFSVNIDSTEVQSPNVSASVPAYVSRISESTIQLHGHVPNSWISVDIDSFSGPGTYPIGANNGVLRQIFGDVALYLATDSLSMGTITVDQYDEISNWCSGRFDFTARFWVYPGDTHIVHRLHEGIFSVPVYR